MAKVTITIEDTPDGKSIDVQVKAKPAFNLKDERKNTGAHWMGARFLEFMRKEQEKGDAPNDGEGQ